MENRLAEIVKRAFPGLLDAGLENLKRGASPWDSIGHLALITTLESELGIKLDIGFSIRVTDWSTLNREFKALRILE